MQCVARAGARLTVSRVCHVVAMDTPDLQEIDEWEKSILN